jgi:aspartyl-tRNA(Asn)/glutamyl-tRNA(Gln) amidotransferase subunit B
MASTEQTYTSTIGIECHVQLSSNTKLFAAVGNDARDASPNTLISHICVGMPGALPVLNEGALKLAAKAAYALGSKPQKFSHFDRKHYFYPDLPKGYQITQYKNPIILGGQVIIDVNGEKKRIGITRAHLEEDAGKTVHPDGTDYSLVDLNRAGTPLLEIVSEPDLHSPLEAKIFARELYLLMRYSEVSEADLYHGNMRFDVNVSVSSNPDSLGIRTETKNLNSFRSVEAAVEYEIKRQTKLLENGEQVIQETRGWDEAKQKTTPQRGKEEAHDYRYFPDPDLPPIELSDGYIAEIEREVSMLPQEVRIALEPLGLNKSIVETLIDNILTAKITMSVLDIGEAEGRIVASWLAGLVQSEVVSGNYTWEDVKNRLNPEELAKLAAIQVRSEISSTSAKNALLEFMRSDKAMDEIISHIPKQMSEEQDLLELVKTVLAENQSAANDIKNGELKAIGYLVGQVMKASGGSANPSVVEKIIKRLLGI